MGRTIFRNRMTWKTMAVVFGIGFLVLVLVLIGAGRPSMLFLVVSAAVTLGLPCLILLGMRFGQPDTVIEVVDRGDTLGVLVAKPDGSFTVPKGPPTKWGMNELDVQTRRQRVEQTYLTFEHAGRRYNLNVAAPQVFDVEAFRQFAPDAVAALGRGGPAVAGGRTASA